MSADDPALPSRSGGAGRDKENRKRPPRSARQARQRRAGAVLGRAEDALARDVKADKITAEQAATCRATLTAVVDLLPDPALERLERNLAGFHWYATADEVDKHYRRNFGGDFAGKVVGYFNRDDATVHLTAESSFATHLHELAHAIDGPDDAISGRREWLRAYNIERGRLGDDAYPASTPQEWLAELTINMLARPDDWAAIRRRVPRSARILERAMYGKA